MNSEVRYVHDSDWCKHFPHRNSHLFRFIASSRKIDPSKDSFFFNFYFFFGIISSTFTQCCSSSIYWFDLHTLTPNYIGGLQSGSNVYQLQWLLLFVNRSQIRIRALPNSFSINVRGESLPRLLPSPVPKLVPIYFLIPYFFQLFGQFRAFWTSCTRWHQVFHVWSVNMFPENRPSKLYLAYQSQ